jgi:hypothetical protein
MDDIARDVAQHQAHNQYVVPADGHGSDEPAGAPAGGHALARHRFPWDELDRDIQEQILQDAQPHARRYFTNPRGGFNWAELELGVRAQIVRHAHPRVQQTYRGEDYPNTWRSRFKS